jgi:hypothetical protein
MQHTQRTRLNSSPPEPITTAELPGAPLDKLDVSDSCLSAASLRGVAKKVVIGDQQSPDQHDVSLGE